MMVDAKEQKTLNVGRCNGCTRESLFVVEVTLRTLSFRLCKKCKVNLQDRLANINIF